MRPRAGPVKTGAEVGGFGSGLAAGLAVGLLGLAALSVAGPWWPATGSAVDLPLPEGGAEPPRYWPGMSPEEQAAREEAAEPVPDAEADRPARVEPAAEGAGLGAVAEAPPSEAGSGSALVEAGPATAEPAVRAGAAPDGPPTEALADEERQVVVDPASPLPEPLPLAEPGGASLPLGADAASDPASASEVGSAVPALLRYAAPFEPPAELRPYLSIVLLDDGSVPDAPDRLGALSVPVSVALDLPTEAAAAREAAWRAAGFEVLAVASLPEDAQPAEVEVVLGAALDALAESVAVLDLGEGGPAARTTLSRTELARVARGGRGLVLAGGAPSSSLDAAAAAGVPAARVLRELDATDQDEGTVRRILDDMARRAAESGEAVVLGRLRSDTLAGLADWAQSGRAGEVTVAPVSALLARMGDVRQER